MSTTARMRADGTLIRTDGERRDEAMTVAPVPPKDADAVLRAALADPDAQPLTVQDMQRLRQRPLARIIRRALGLTQEQFAQAFGIPLGTLRDWEQGRSEPDQPARSYLTVIAHAPDAVRQALRGERGDVVVEGIPLP